MAGANIASAQVIWNQTSGTNAWATGANWVGGSAPTGGQIAEFSNSGTQQVTVNPDAIVGLINFQFTSGTLELNAASLGTVIRAQSGDVNVGNDTSGATVNLIRGSLDALGGLNVGNIASGTSSNNTLNVQGSSSQVRVGYNTPNNRRFDVLNGLNHGRC